MIVDGIDDCQHVELLDKPRQLTVEINDTWVGALHIFGNPPEIDLPRRDDPNVIFYGPGIHEAGSLTVPSGKTVYVAGGAIVRGVIKPDEKFHISSYSGLNRHRNGPSPASEVTPPAAATRAQA